jgi:hypothetical protein
MTPTQTEPQALTVEQIEALEWPDLLTSVSIPAWDKSVSTPYGVAWLGDLDGMPGDIRGVYAYLDDGSPVLWNRGQGWSRTE